jgi:ppGpp synthetase/RelA/SpoT-type nucleotidyltranferase
MPSLDFENEQKVFKEYYQTNLETLKQTEKKLRELIESVLSDIDRPPVTSRIKDRDESIRKFELKYRERFESEAKAYEIKENITDLVGMRVTCYYQSDVPRVEELLRQNFDLVGRTDKAALMEAEADTFGYKGLHLDLCLNSDRRELPEWRFVKKAQLKSIEVQVRTIVQHAWSELDHKIAYKRSIPKPLKRRILALAALFELADREFEAAKSEANRLAEQAQRIENKKKQSAEEVKMPLDAFHAQAILRKNFENEDIADSFVDSFVTKILDCEASFTTGDFEDAFRKHLPTVENYAAFRDQCDSHRPKALTRTRYVLYLSNPTTFEPMLFDKQRQAFGEWYEKGKADKDKKKA